MEHLAITKHDLIRQNKLPSSITYMKAKWCHGEERDFHLRRHIAAVSDLKSFYWVLICHIDMTEYCLTNSWCQQFSRIRRKRTIFWKAIWSGLSVSWFGWTGTNFSWCCNGITTGWAANFGPQMQSILQVSIFVLFQFIKLELLMQDLF